jgi:hypothetical protein
MVMELHKHHDGEASLFSQAAGDREINRVLRDEKVVNLERYRNSDSVLPQKRLTELRSGEQLANG